MWMNSGKNNFPSRGFSTPPPSRKSRPFQSPRTAPFSERKRSSPNSAIKPDLFHVIHKVPAGDSPYVKAKQVQLIEKDPSRAVSLFWAAINVGDRVDSALKDMAVVMKQLDRSDEAIEAIRSFRHLCPYDSQESIDNVLIELYKRSGRIQEEIDMLQCKLRQIEEGTVFGGKRTKAARSQGKKVQITIEQEKSRVLGNLAWAFLQLDNIYVAEDYYRKALSLESDNNKKCNLAICLILTNRLTEAKSLLQSVRASSGGKPMEESYAKSYERASHMLAEKESKSSFNSIGQEEDNSVVSTTTSKSTTVSTGPSVSSLVNASTRWTPDDDEMYLNENNRDDHQWERYENKSFGAVNSSHNYLQCDDKWSEGCCIPIKMSEIQNQDGSLRVVDESFNCCSLYSSPTPARRNVEVPFTQPKNSFWEFNNNRRRPKERSQRKVTTSRKTLFENKSVKDQSFVNGFAVDASSESEGTGATSNYKTKYRSADSDAVELEVPFTQPRSCSWGINEGERQRKATECFRGLHGSSSRKLSFESHSSTQNILQGLTDPSFGRSELSRAGTDESQELDAEWKQNSCGEYEHITVDQKFKHNSSTVGGKKSWADMVEEEEEDGADDDDEKEVDTEETTSSSGRGEVLNCFDDWSNSSSCNEEFNDENINSNIFHQNNQSLSSNQVEDIIKIGSLDIKDGANKDSVDDIVSSRNPAVRRPLYFDQQPIKMLDSTTDQCRSSPLPRKDLTNEISFNSGTTVTGENVLIRRNRLQVFQEMTVHQELEC